MSWNHRVMRTTQADGTFAYQIHEVYYHDDGSIKAWTVNPTTPFGETIKELHGDVMRFERACTRHILDVRGDELYDIGLTGHTRLAPVCVYRRSAQPASVGAVDPVEGRVEG